MKNNSYFINVIILISIAGIITNIKNNQVIDILFIIILAIAVFLRIDLFKNAHKDISKINVHEKI